MARSPILNMVSIIVATGTTYNIAADRIHPIGPWEIPNILLRQLARIPYLGDTYIPSLETPNAIGYIAKSHSDIAIEADCIAL
eukprot:3111474-Pleurochrysis_carterae.AAC.1